jgi:hypothetical protein
MPGVDSDGDGCTDAQESAMGFNPNAWYDFYDVPVPANQDPTANGPKNQAVTFGDILATLFYAGTCDGCAANLNGVDYDSIKGSCDWNGDTTADKEGLCYDRSPGPLPNPPYDAGAPNGAVNFQDVVIMLNQVGLVCRTG